jgi:hypothetical protein
MRALNGPWHHRRASTGSLSSCRPVPDRRGRMTFTFRLERTDGKTADPPSFKTAVPNRRPGYPIPLGRGRTARVLGVRDDDADRPPVLVVEDIDHGRKTA